MIRERLGRTLGLVGVLLGAVNYLITAAYFFRNDETALAVILLLVPPSEFILPWLATTALGIVSVVSLALMIIGDVISPE